MLNDAPLLSFAAASGADLGARASIMMMTTTMTRKRGGSG